MVHKSYGSTKILVWGWGTLPFAYRWKPEKAVWNSLLTSPASGLLHCTVASWWLQLMAALTPILELNFHIYQSSIPKADGLLGHEVLWMYKAQNYPLFALQQWVASVQKVITRSDCKINFLHLQEPKTQKRNTAGANGPLEEGANGCRSFLSSPPITTCHGTCMFGAGLWRKERTKSPFPSLPSVKQCHNSLHGYLSTCVP